MNQRIIGRALSIGIGVLGIFGTTVEGGPLPIVELPLNTSEPLPHTLFHSSDWSYGTGGAILGWGALDPATPSTYDPVGGVLDLHLDIFAESSFTNFLGNAHGTSNDLKASEFNDFDGSIIGTITWEFDGYLPAAFELLPFDPDTDTVTMSFPDFDYGPSAAGFNFASYEGQALTLEGADGTYLGDGKFDTSTTSLGFEFVGIVAPEPSSLALLATGLLTLAGAGWRRRGRSTAA